MLGPTEHTGFGEIPNTLLGGIGHTDVTGDMHTPGFGDMETPPAVGDIPITPARSCGDIYATVTAGHGGDGQTSQAIGNMYAGLWARRFGVMPTT